MATKKSTTRKKTASKKIGKKASIEANIQKLSIDSDHDGLSDYQEYLYGTNPLVADTDNDGLSDYEEIKIYQTNANKADTNFNGIKDGDEVKYGKNPRGQGLLKDLFIPHSGNSYQPEFLKTKRLFWYSASALVIKSLVLFFIVSLPITAWVTPDVAKEQALKIIDYTNEVRKNLNLSPLKENEKLNQAALEKCQDMLAEQYFAHVSPKGFGVSHWLKLLDFNYAVAGENLAMGFSNASDVVNAWTKSKSHYANIIDPDFTEIGVGMVSGKFKQYDTTFVAQVFAAGLNKNETSTYQNSGINVLPTSTTSIKKVLGTKIIAQPTWLLPAENFIGNSNDFNIKIYAPGADQVAIYNQSENIINLIAEGNGYFSGKTKIEDGNYQLKAIAQKGTLQASATSSLVTIDSQGPTVNQNLSSLMVSQEDGSGTRIVRASTFLSSDTKEATIYFGNYQINLKPDAHELGKWTGSSLIFNQDEEQIFQPVVLPTIIALDQAGNKSVEDITWQNITPVKSTILNQYFWAKNNSSIYAKAIFMVSSIYFKILLGLMIVALMLNILIEYKKQQPKVIAVSLIFIGLLIFLIVF